LERSIGNVRFGSKADIRVMPLIALRGEVGARRYPN